MAKKDNTLLYLAGAGVLAYLVLSKQKPKPATIIAPGGGLMATPVSNNLLTSLLSPITALVTSLTGGTAGTDLPASYVSTINETNLQGLDQNTSLLSSETSYQPPALQLDQPEIDQVSINDPLQSYYDDVFNI